jgi:mono/diheme cytochrome c family protein
MNIKHLIFVSFLFFFTGCKDENVESDSAVSNGKTIFSTGKNNQGVVLQDLQKSEMNGMVQGCANCHGEDGKLGASGAKDLTLSTLTDAEVLQRINEGKNGMPQMKSVLETKENVTAVAEYVKGMRK